MKGPGAHPKECDMYGQYIDTRMFKNIAPEYLKKNVLPLNSTRLAAGITLTLQDTTGQIHQIDINQLNQQGVKGVSPFRCPVISCIDTFPRRWCVDRHFKVCHSAEEKEGLTYIDHVTMSSYSGYGEQKPGYKRTPKVKTETQVSGDGGVSKAGRKRKLTSKATESNPVNNAQPIDPGQFNPYQNGFGLESVVQNLGSVPYQMSTTFAPAVASSANVNAQPGLPTIPELEENCGQFFAAPQAPANANLSFDSLPRLSPDNDEISTGHAGSFYEPSPELADDAYVETEEVPTRSSKRAKKAPNSTTKPAPKPARATRSQRNTKPAPVPEPAVQEPVEGHPIFMYEPRRPTYYSDPEVMAQMTPDELLYGVEELEDLMYPAGPYSGVHQGPYWT